MSFADCREVELVRVKNIGKTSTVIQPQTYLTTIYKSDSRCCNLNMSGYSCKSKGERSTHPGCCLE
jgi:hypothetical protein